MKIQAEESSEGIRLKECKQTTRKKVKNQIPKQRTQKQKEENPTRKLHIERMKTKAKANYKLRRHSIAKMQTS